jgi:hypothetical protein
MADEAILLDGFAGLDAALSALADEALERQTLINAGMRALQPVQAEARRLVPVHEGKLRDSLLIATNGLTRDAARDEIIDKGAVRIFFGTANRNGVPREFGTFRSVAKPFARPAWDANVDSMLDTLAAEIGPGVEAAAERLSKRRGRKG